MITSDILSAQTAIELPSREMLSPWSINIAVPIIIQNNINIQVCNVVYGTCNIYQGGQWNGGGIIVNFP